MEFNHRTKQCYVDKHVFACIVVITLKTPMYDNLLQMCGKCVVKVSIMQYPH